MKKYVLVSILLFCSILWGANPSVLVEDNPNDDGSKIRITWELNDTEISKIELFKKKSGQFVHLADMAPSKGIYLDQDEVEPGVENSYKIIFYNLSGEVVKKFSETAVSTSQWFNAGKISMLIFGLIVSLAIIYYIFSAKSGKSLYIRKIAGLESIDEAVGRATEMGKPILFIPGTLDIDNMQTIAGLTILGTVATKAAEYGTKIIVPVNRSMVLSTAREVVKQSFIKVGREDLYNEDDIFYLTDDQFGYVSGVDGIIVREEPAANFFLGAFYAESLILAETGFSAGSIQVSGTAMPAQLPFFVAACDYTLIGEELFAASAYLSKDPQQLGSLKGQDVGKAIFLFVLITGVILEMFNIHFLKDFLMTN